MPPTPSLRPLELGELIDRTIRFWRAHLKPLFGLGLAFQLLMYALIKSVSVLTQRWMPGLSRGELPSFSSTPGLGPALLACVALISLYAWVYWASTVAASAYVIPLLLDRPSTPGGALRRVGARFWTVTGSLLVAGGVMLVGFAVMMVPFVAAIVVGALLGNVGKIVLILLSLVAMFVCLVVLLWVYLRLALAGPVLGFESLGPMRSLWRSSRLVSGRIGPGVLGRVVVRAGIVFSVVFVLLFVVNLLSGLPALILGATYGGLANGMVSVPQVLLVPAELLQVLVQGLFAPIAWVFAAVFYLDVRVRKEGFDLELQLAPGAA